MSCSSAASESGIVIGDIVAALIIFYGIPLALYLLGVACRGNRLAFDRGLGHRRLGHRQHLPRLHAHGGPSLPRTRSPLTRNGPSKPVARSIRA